MEVFTPKKLSEIIGVTPQTLSQWANDGKLKVVKTQGGHRRYLFQQVAKSASSVEQKAYCYARVSSAKQKGDLQRQVALLKAQYPNHQILEDIGSGINFRRRGLITLLERVFAGDVSEVVVAHRDRLTRFGFELFEYIFKRFKVSLRILSDDGTREPIQELAKDLLSIVTVFTARYYGSRNYSNKENKNLPKQKTTRSLQQMPRRIKVLLQPRSAHNRRNRSARNENLEP